MLDEINRLPVDQFVGRFGFLFDHSPWVVERAATLRPFVDLDHMRAVMMFVVDRASEAERLALLRAHPRLADKVAQAKGLTKESTQEQASLGLDRLSPDDYARFAALNDAYDQRFGFPFIICVRRTDKAGVLAAMEQRLRNDPADERVAALAEIARIVDFRLVDAVVESGA